MHRRTCLIISTIHSIAKSLYSRQANREYTVGMSNLVTFDDFEKVDIRAGKIIDVQDFPEARKPAYKLKIDFGAEIGIKQSSVQAVGAHAKEELLNSLVCCVVNFPPKQVGPFVSEVLTLGFKNNAGTGWVLIEPKNENVDLGSKLM
jgi:tRNA-binding protein